MEKFSDSQSSSLPLELQIKRRQRTNLYKPRNITRSTITEEENAAEILIMMSRYISFFKPPPPKSKPKPTIEFASSPKSGPVAPSKFRCDSKGESSTKPQSVSSPESSVRNSLHQCSTCGKTFPSHQALGGHKTMHNRPNLKRKRPDSEFPLVNGVIPVLEKRGTVERSKSDVPLVPVRDKLSSKPHVCKECNKVFPTGQALGGHMREHFKGVISHQIKKVEHLHDKTKLKSRKSEPKTVAEVPTLVPVVNEGEPVQAVEKKAKFEFEFDLNLLPEMQSSDCEKNNGGCGAV